MNAKFRWHYISVWSFFYRLLPLALESTNVTFVLFRV